MPADYLQFATTLGRDFKAIRSMVDRIVGCANPDDPASVDEAGLEAVKYVETRCAEGGSTMIFRQSTQPLNREKLSNALALLVRHRIEAKRRTPGA
jgi:hypothetical protein